MESQYHYERYIRQVLLNELGTSGQDRLSMAKVLVIGAGGLGCPALQYLAAAGVGTIGILDFDHVELSNLQRQPLYDPEDTGKAKAVCAANKLKRFNPGVQFNTHNLKLLPANALEIIRPYDIVIDGTDNFATRYLVNDACLILSKPLVYGAVLRFEGQAGVFNLADTESGIKTNYRDLFPKPPAPSSVPSCNEAGVLGVLPGIIGTMQAAEAIKIIAGLGQPLCNKILSINISTNLFYEFSISPLTDQIVQGPNSPEELLNFDYDWFCGMDTVDLEISCDDFDRLRNDGELIIIDIRERGELPEVNEFDFMQIPSGELEEAFTEPLYGKKVVLFCRSGNRSIRAAEMLKKKFPACRIYSLTGGIDTWKRHQGRLVTK